MAPEDLDLEAAMQPPAGQPPEVDFEAAMSPPLRSRPSKSPAPTSPTSPPAPPSSSIRYIYKENDIVILDSKDDRGIKNNKSKNIKDLLTLQELTFLEIYFSAPRLKGQNRITIDKAMIAAGYGHLHEESRYRLARKIVWKYDKTAPGAAQVFRDIGFGVSRVAQGIAEHAECAQSEAVSLNALALAARCQGMTEEKRDLMPGINIIINTAPASVPGSPAGAPGPVQVVIAGQDDGAAPALPRRPLQITR